MRLVSARLRNFRLFEDTGEVPIDRITVLLAQNENGKTAFLQGLAWFSAEGVKEIDEDDVWQGAKGGSSKMSVSLTFVREKGDEEKLKAHGIALPKRLRATRLGENAQYAFEEADTGAWVGSRSEAEARKAFEEQRDALRQMLKQVSVANVNKTRALNALRTLTSFHPKFGAEYLVGRNVKALLPELTAEAQTQLTPALATFLERTTDLEDASSTGDDLILKVLPKLIYFDAEVDTLPDRATYAEIKDEPSANRTIVNLGRLAGVNFDFIPSDPHRRLQRGREFQETISKETSRFWRGHDVTFEVGLDEDAVTVSVVSEGRFQKPTRRSRGMRWYHGFHINFMAETKRDLSGAVLLIDEPGLFLHPSAQEGLLELFEEIAKENQIVYSTHMPFMIPKERPDRIRLLVEQNDGTVAVESRPHRRSDADVMKPLRAAVGMSIADTISLGTRSLVCEGMADLYILRAASSFNERTSRTHLPKTTTLLPAGGTDKILPLASFIVGEVIDGVVLVDDDVGGRRIETQIEKRFAALVPVVRTHDTPRTDAASGMEIEDLLDEAYYCDLINESHTHVLGYVPLNPADIAGPGALVDRVKAAFAARGLGEFQKLLPAIAFAARIDAGDPPDDATLDRFVDLFERLRTGRLARP